MTRTRTMLASVGIVIFLGTISTAHALANDPAPTLTEIQHLKVQNALQAVEIAQLHIQSAQAELEHSRTSAVDLLHTLEVPGYDLNLQTLTYVKKAVSEQKGNPKK